MNLSIRANIELKSFRKVPTMPTKFLKALPIITLEVLAVVPTPLTIKSLKPFHTKGFRNVGSLLATCQHFSKGFFVLTPEKGESAYS